jgi:TolB protein
MSAGDGCAQLAYARIVSRGNRSSSPWRLYSCALAAKAAGVGLVAVLALFLGACRHGAQEPEASVWRIVFTSDRGGEFALWSIRPDGGGLARIGAESGYPGALPPVVAPEGTKLLLPRGGEFVVLDSDGRRRLGAGDATTASWSRDGERIAFLAFGISTMDADGDNRRRLTRNDGDRSLLWSPTDDRIAFLRDAVGIGVVEADGTGARIIWRGGARALSWSEDGRSLSFLRVRGDRPTGEVITIDAETGRLLRTARGVDVDFYTVVAWSPHGRRLAFERWFEREQRYEIIVMNRDGTDRRRLTGPRESARGPVWAPDGRSIVYTRDGVEGSQLWTVRLDGAGRRRITRGLPGGGNAFAPAWARIGFRHQPSPLSVRARRTERGGELEVPFPVVALGASGSRAALASPVRVYSPAWILTPPLVLWDAAAGDVSRLNMRNCDAPDSIVLVGGQVAFDCRRIPHAVAYFGGSVYVSFDQGRRAVALNPGVVDAEGGKPGRLPGRVAGGSRAIVFTVDAFDAEADYAGSTLWRVRGRRSERISVDVGEPVAVDRGRVVTEHPNGRVALLDVDGRLIRVFAPGGRGESPPVYGARRPPTVGLSGPDLVVLRGGRLVLYEAVSGRRSGALRIEEGAVFAGVARGLVAYVAGRDVHVVRLRDRAEAVVRAPGRSVKARLTNAGLFYAFHKRAVKRRTIPQHELNPGRVVFLRREFVESQLR